jgi:hypothetical protein
MTVHVGPTGIESDVCPAGAGATPNGRFALHDVDGSRLGSDVGSNVLSRVRRASGDQSAGEATELGAALVELRGVDGVVVDRDTARAVVVRAEEAALARISGQGRCHMAVAIGDHPPIDYQADRAVAQVFADELGTHGRVTIDDALSPEYPKLPYERLFRS